MECGYDQDIIYDIIIEKLKYFKIFSLADSEIYICVVCPHCSEPMDRQDHHGRQSVQLLAEKETDISQSCFRECHPMT